MGNRFFISCLIVFFFSNAKAQLGKESWHWQFGFHNALDFSSGTPVASSSAINTVEGCASISDSNTGALLFYTDGDSVWDRNNNLMPNGTGLIGNQGSTQSALIIQQPGSANIYYLITCDAGFYAGTQGIHYSIVDMTLNGGLGDVTTKNKVLTPPPTTEKLTAVKHCNGKDFWIISHPYNSNTFNSYLFTSSGIDTTPVTSNAGVIQQGPNNEVGGYLRPSPNGKKLAYAVEYISVFEMVDFDNSTGKVSNPISVTYPGAIGFNGTHLPYGVAFSPDNSKVYVSDFKGFIFQYDLSSGDSGIIVASQTTINTGLYGLGAIQLAPNGKIYLTVYAKSFLSVINNPNSLTCNFQASGVNLLAADSGAFGLPNFIDIGNIAPTYTADYLPLCSVASYTLNAGAGNTHYQWSNGDTTQTITINSFGNYAVNYTTSQGCYNIDTFFVSLAPPLSSFQNISLCTVPAYTLDAGQGNSHFQWSTNDTTQSISIHNFGNYAVNYITAQGCRVIDTFFVSQIPEPVITVLRDTIICSNTPVPLNVDATYPNTLAYLWSDGFTAATHTISAQGLYWVNYTLPNFCTASDSFTFFVDSIPKLSLGKDTSLCQTYYTINANTNLACLWSTGATSPQITVTKSGNYELTVTNAKGCKNSDAINVMLYNTPVLPNIVTPNNDGINDYVDFGNYGFTYLQLYIYNRWGTKIFESADPHCIWKPDANDGTYYWILNYHDCGNIADIKTLKGFISLIR